MANPSRRVGLALCAALACLACACGPAPTGTATLAATPTALPPTSTNPPRIPTLEPSSELTLRATADPSSQVLDQQAAGLLPEHVQDLDRLEQATRYWIQAEVQFDPLEQRALIEGQADIQFTNPLDEPLHDIVVMLWPNDPQYYSQMRLGPALIGSDQVLPISELDGLAQRYALASALGPGEALRLSVPFQVQAAGPIGSGIPRRFGISQGVFFAPTFYPLVPRLVDGDWDVIPAPPGGDTTNSEVAFYWVELSLPPEFQLVATGVEVEREIGQDGRQRLNLVSGPTRDFAFALGTFEQQSRTVNGVRVNAWVIPEHVPDLAQMLDSAAVQLGLLQELVGPYPYPELDVVDLPGAYGGIEYPGIVTIGTLGGLNVVFPTVHEVGHQWFYGLIGDDQLREPWLDEAAAMYTEVLYLERTAGSGAASGMLTDFREVVRAQLDPSLPIGLSIEEYGTSSEYYVFVYRKGPLFFDALRGELGDQTFFEFLQAYYLAFRYRVATAQDFHAMAEQVCNCDLEALFDLWVYRGGEIPGL